MVQEFTNGGYKLKHKKLFMLKSRTLRHIYTDRKRTYKIQECIPVGCVPAARKPYAAVCFPGGVCLVRGVYAWSWGVCLVRGCLPGPEGAAWCGEGGLPGPRGGVCLVQGGSGIPACTEADTLPPCGQTHTCKNITLATTSLRPVNIATRWLHNKFSVHKIQLKGVRLDQVDLHGYKNKFPSIATRLKTRTVKLIHQAHTGS